MYPTIKSGQFILVGKIAFSGRSPVPCLFGTQRGRIPACQMMRGDVVTFIDHSGRLEVKRIVGNGHDYVSVVDGHLRLNARSQASGLESVKVKVRGVTGIVSKECSPSSCYKIVVFDRPDLRRTFNRRVSPGRLFLLGDNRNFSSDSRFAAPQGTGEIAPARVSGLVWLAFGPAS